MTISRRAMLAAPALMIPATSIAQSRTLSLSGASYDMRDPILREFQRRTNATPHSWVIRSLMLSSAEKNLMSSRAARRRFRGGVGNGQRLSPRSAS